MLLPRRSMKLRKKQHALALERMEDRQLLSAVPFSSDIEIGPSEYLPSHARDVWLNDLDLDGDLDLAIHAGGNHDATSGVSWRLNAGDGTFGEIHYESTHGQIQAVPLWADIDGDGDDDLVRNNLNASYWFENQFSDGGTFSSQEQQIVVADADFVVRVTAVADFNNDGLDDFVTSDGWVRNLGGGAFEAHRIQDQSIASGSQVVDYDGDGDLDIFNRLRSNQTSIIENVGGEDVLTEPRVIDIWTHPDSVPHDLDHDGDTDFVFVEGQSFRDRTGQKIRWYENTGDNLELKTIREFEFNAQQVSHVQVQFDASGDGMSDLIFKDYWGFQVGWFEDLAVSAWSEIDVPFYNHYDTGDIDNDGDLDWVGVSSGGEVAWLDNATASPEANVIADPSPFILRNISSTDFDGDGDQDLLFNFGNGLSWYENLGEQDFAPVETLVEVASGLDVVDLNGDGLPDVAYQVVFESGQRMQIWQPNLGNGAVGEPIVLPVERRTAFFDVDGDGDQDLHSDMFGERAVWLNDGNGNFPESIEVPAGTLTASDVDQDGDFDLISESTGLRLHKNLGDNAYSDGVVIANHIVFDSIWEHVVFDADMDGDDDIVLTRSPELSGFSDTQDFELFENQGGGFVRVSDVERTGYFNDLTVADLDGDGDQDLLSETYYLENLGGLNFESPRPLDQSPLVWEVIPTDIDGDGLLDLAAIRADRVVWYENQLDIVPAPITPVDVDRLYAAIESGSTDLIHDWNDDGLVSEADVDYLIVEVVGTQRGDLNLNGQVDFQDFLRLSGAFGREDVGWADGDLDGDRQVGFADFLILAQAFGRF